MLLPVLALSTALLGESSLSRRGEAIPGIAQETLGQSPIGEEGGDKLMLLRVTVEPAASVPARDEPRAVVILLEEVCIGNTLELVADEANLTLASGNGTVPLTPSSETILGPGNSVSSGIGTPHLTLHNAGDGEEMLSAPRPSSW